MKTILLRLPPSDRAMLGILALAVLVAAVRLPVIGPGLQGPLVFHAGLLAAVAVAVAAMAQWERQTWVLYARPTLTVFVVFTLYSTLGQLGIAAFPPGVDAGLSRADNGLFGLDPSLALQRYQTPGWIEFFSFIYAAFIPYIHLSLFLGCLGRPPLERDQFLTGWTFTYAISYLGYLFLPAHGPVIYHARDYHVSLQGGYFYNLVLQGVEASGGLQGAFPSLHVGGSVYLCLFDLKTHRLRGLTYLPMVLLIYLSTLFLRYHYVVDLIAGTILAAGCIPLGQAVFLRWAQRRQASGLPALPGGEGDVLPHISGPGTLDDPRLLPAH